MTSILEKRPRNYQTKLVETVESLHIPTKNTDFSKLSYEFWKAWLTHSWIKHIEIQFRPTFTGTGITKESLQFFEGLWRLLNEHMSKKTLISDTLETLKITFDNRAWRYYDTNPKNGWTPSFKLVDYMFKELYRSTSVCDLLTVGIKPATMRCLYAVRPLTLKVLVLPVVLIQNNMREYKENQNLNKALTRLCVDVLRLVAPKAQLTLHCLTESLTVPPLVDALKEKTVRDYVKAEGLEPYIGLEVC